MSSSPKIPFYGRRPTTRTTTGCQTCRQRRLKCDEAKPTCARCARGDLECSYGVQIRWPMPGAKPGNNRARKEKTRRRAPPASPHSDVRHFDAEQEHMAADSSKTITTSLSPTNITWSPSELGDGAFQDGDPFDFNTLDFDLDLIERGSSPAKAENFCPSPGSSLTPANPESQETFIPALSLDAYPVPDMKGDDKMLFNFYACKMCPRCVVRNGDNNNYRQVVLPLVHQSPLLLKAVLAVAANGVRVHDSRFHSAALRYQTEALQGLQESVTTKKQTSFSRLEILGVILMLCFFEIYSPSHSVATAGDVPIRPWMTHSYGVCNLIEQGIFATSVDSQYEQSLLSFLGQYFASRSVLTYTALSQYEDHDEMLRNATYWLSLIDRPHTEINPFAGCSNELLGLILEISSELRKEKTLAEYSTVSRERMEEMRARLQLIKQHAPSKTSSSFINEISGQAEASGASAQSVQKTAEAFRLAALVLLETQCDPEGNGDPESDDNINRMFWLLDSGYTLPPRGKLGSTSFLWPLFITGCHLKSADQQASMLDHTRKLITGDGSESWPRNAMAEKIQDVMVHVWLARNRSGAAISSTSTRYPQFVWESDLIPSQHIFEWM